MVATSSIAKTPISTHMIQKSSVELLKCESSPCDALDGMFGTDEDIAKRTGDNLLPHVLSGLRIPAT